MLRTSARNKALEMDDMCLIYWSMSFWTTRMQNWSCKIYDAHIKAA